MCLHIIHNTVTFTILIMYKYKQWFRSTIMYWNCHIKWTHLVSGYKSPYHLSSKYNKTKSYSPSVSATTCKNSSWLWFWQWNRWQPPNLQHVSVWIDTNPNRNKRLESSYLQTPEHSHNEKPLLFIEKSFSWKHFFKMCFSWAFQPSTLRHRSDKGTED